MCPPAICHSVALGFNGVIIMNIHKHLDENIFIEKKTC